MAIAIKDATAGTGGKLSSGIGISPSDIFPASQVEGPGFQYGPIANNLAPLSRIGSAPGTGIVEVVGGKTLKFLKTTGTVAIDAVVATGWVNKTGVALPAGVYVWAVAV